MTEEQITKNEHWEECCQQTYDDYVERVSKASGGSPKDVPPPIAFECRGCFVLWERDPENEKLEFHPDEKSVKQRGSQCNCDPEEEIKEWAEHDKTRKRGYWDHRRWKVLRIHRREEHDLTDEKIDEMIESAYGEGNICECGVPNCFNRRSRSGGVGDIGDVQAHHHPHPGGVLLSYEWDGYDTTGAPLTECRFKRCDLPLDVPKRFRPSKQLKSVIRAIADAQEALSSAALSYTNLLLKHGVEVEDDLFYRFQITSIWLNGANKEDLRDACRERELKISGNKAVLRTRLEEFGE
ncbi:hypothetical protein LCGC14_0621120 [marine sediment metagenome]|uniref:SAP domain-containing protein n=1 Tax=marine sediment metagenome TaxID=412755 RepID=A0A0F9R4R0_9ZZZZ